MKFIAVRTKKDKDPVMLIAGKLSDWTLHGFFQKIDEVTDPYECEYKEVNIDMDFFSITWPSPMKSVEEKFEGAEMDHDFTVEYINKHFEKEEGWIETFSWEDFLQDEGE